MKVVPEHSLAQARLAQFLYWLGQYGQALTEYRNALALNPKDTGLRREYGQLLLLTGRHDEAVHVYRRLVKELPKDESVERGYLQAIGGASKMEKTERIWIKDFYRSRFLDEKAKPLRVSTLAALGRALTVAGLTEEAIVVYEAAVKRAPEDTMLRLAYADLLSAAGRLVEAEEQYEVLLQQVGKMSKEPSP